MDSYRIIRCGLGWAYCNGNCMDCAYARISTSSHIGNYHCEEVYGKKTTTDNKTRWSGVYTGEHKE